MRHKDEAAECLTRVECDSTASVGRMSYDIWERSGGRHRGLLESGPTATLLSPVVVYPSRCCGHTHQANEDRRNVTLKVNALNVGAQFCRKRVANKTISFLFIYFYNK